MFEPKPPLAFHAPVPHIDSKPYHGLALFVNAFEKEPPPPRDPFEPPIERKKRMKEQLRKLNEEKLELLKQQWRPHDNSKSTGYLLGFYSPLSYSSPFVSFNPPLISILLLIIL